MTQTQRKVVIFLSIMTLIVMWIDYHIESRNMAFYTGKDNGFLVRIISICLLSALFYGFLAKKNHIPMSFVGFLAGLICSFISYLVWFLFLDDYGLSFHIIACVLFMLLFRIICLFFPTILKS